MSLFLLALVSILSFSSEKKISQNGPSFYKSVTETHFGKFEDFKNVHIPPEKQPFEVNSAHPHQFNLTNDGSGNYYFGFNTFDLKRFEIGELKNAGTDNEVQVVRGQYTETIYDSSIRVEATRTIGYIADENGYRPFLINVRIHPATGEKPGGPGAPKGDKPEISAALVGSLVGGNSIG